MYAPSLARNFTANVSHRLHAGNLRWLIVEDALRDQSGHWFEYIQTFRQGLAAVGDDVTILADREAIPLVRDGLQALPVLPRSIWHRMSDGAGKLARYLRVPGHACATVRAMRKYFRAAPTADVVFVPTVLVHHLLAWTWLAKRSSIPQASRVLLFFPNAPVRLTEKGSAEWIPSPTTRLFRYLLRALGPAVRSGRVILGAETGPMCDTLTEVSGLPFTYFPHPVAPVVANETLNSMNGRILMGSYGGARHEKGNDLLYRAVAEFLQRYPNCRATFAFQCLDGFAEERRALEIEPRVSWIARYFREGEYASQLARTDVMLLPYRRSSYSLRVSRVAIEAMVNGIPMVVTRGTTLGEQARQFGAAVECEEDDKVSLAEAIQRAEYGYEELAAGARSRAADARKHFSVEHFRECLGGAT